MRIRFKDKVIAQFGGEERAGLDIDSRVPYLARMEWEALQDKWEIDDLKESPALPWGAEKISIWRDAQYKIVARVTGTPAGSTNEMLPSYGAPGTIMPNLDIEGSGMHGLYEYHLSHCVPGRISVRGGESFEAELTTHSVRRMFPRREPTTPVWLTEWYLNGYSGRSFIYPRLTHREFKEEYRKERKFIGLDDTFEGAQTGSSMPCALVETSEVTFIVEPVPDKLGPSWSTCLGIEYREDLGGIPDADVRNAVAKIVGFVMGRSLIHVGYTSFDGRGVPIEQVVISPLEEDLLHISRSSETPVRIDKGMPTDTFEVVLRELVPSYLKRRSALNLDQALWGYWLSERSPLGANLPALATSVEIVKNAWFKSSGSKSQGTYMPKEKFDDLFADEFAAVKAKLVGIEHADRILSRMQGSYRFGANESFEIFFDEIGLPIGKVDRDAIRARNLMAHGSSDLFDKEKYQKMIDITLAYRTLFNRMCLKLLDYKGAYIDRSSDDWPERPLDEPMGGRAKPEDR